jgi:hypothetical protein
MLPQIEAYHASREASRDAYDKEIASLRERRNAGDFATRVFNVLTGEQDKLWNLRIETAWDLLMVDTDPLVAWIAINCQEYREQAVEVLDQLPLDLEGLKQLRIDRGWCGEYAEFLERALNDGVITEPGVTREQRAVVAWVRDRAYLPVTDRKELNRKLGALVAVAVTAARQQWEDEHGLTEQATDAENAAHEPDNED